MLFKKIIFFYFIYVSSLCAQSPKNNIDIYPPSPEASSFTIFGNNTIENGGGFSETISLFDFSEKDIYLNAHLSYYSNGVLIDKQYGSAGVDWSVQVGGVISRVIKGKDDQLYQNARWYPETVSISPEFDYNNVYAAVDGHSLDTEMDWYYYNVNGFSGMFYIDADNNINISSKSGKITIINSQEGLESNEFTLYDGNGYTYIFGGDLQFLETSSYLNTCSKNYHVGMITSWYLKKIISPSNNIVLFEYQEELRNFVSGYTDELIMESECKCTVQDADLYSETRSLCVQLVSTNSKLLKKIVGNNNSVSFKYQLHRNINLIDKIIINAGNKKIKTVEFSFDEIKPKSTHKNYTLRSNVYNYRYFLKHIQKYGIEKDLHQKYSFEYNNPEALPEPFSFRKDRYGYYKRNSLNRPYEKLKTSKYYFILNRNKDFFEDKSVDHSSVDYGTLRKITYPTGGSILIDYEPNKTITNKSRAESLTKQITVHKGINSFEATTSFIFESTGHKINLISNVYFQNEESISEEQKLYYKYWIKITNLSTQKIILNKNLDIDEKYITDPDAPDKPIYSPSIATMKGNIYKIELIIVEKRDVYESKELYGNLLISYNNIKTLENEPLYAGGVRVSSIKQYTSKNKLFTENKFYYNSLNHYPSDESSINSIYQPKYVYDYIFQKPCLSKCSPFYCDGQRHESICRNIIKQLNDNSKRFIVSNNSIANLYNNKESKVYYSVITQFSHDYKHAIEKQYFIPSSSNSTIIKEPLIPNLPVSSPTQQLYGLIKKNLYYIFDGQNYHKIKSKSFNYGIKDFKNVPIYTFRKNWETDIKYENDYEVIQSPLYLLENISIGKYFNSSGFAVLKSEKEISYFKDSIKNIETSKTYEYENLFSLKPTNIKHINSAGKLSENKISYAHDLNISLLIKNNRYGIPLKNETYFDGEKISESYTEYEQNHPKTNLILPKRIYSNKGSKNIVPEYNIDNLQLTYEKYDSRGNILQYRIKNNIPISIIWGYNKQYPLAKIEGETYSDVKPFVTNLQRLANQDTNENAENALRLELQNLRESFPNAMVTTYTYNPLIGVTSETSPNGLVIFYKYDGFGRLINIVDVDGNILKEIDYNYRTSND